MDEAVAVDGSSDAMCEQGDGDAMRCERCD